MMVVGEQQDRGVYTGDIIEELEWNMQSRPDIAQ